MGKQLIKLVFFLFFWNCSINCHKSEKSIKESLKAKLPMKTAFSHVMVCDFEKCFINSYSYMSEVSPETIT